MTYDVLKDFTDDTYLVPSLVDGVQVKKPLTKSVGETFIPAEIHYPTNRINARVAKGELRLIEKVATDEPKAKAKHK